MRRLVAAVAALGVVVGGLTVLPAATAVPAEPVDGLPGFTPDPVRWGDCDDPRLVDAGAECGFVEVPLDYAKPTEDRIKLAVSRVRHRGPDGKYQGPMLVNPGGPGGSGLIYAVFGDLVPDGGGDGYDWIGFDPRGVGASTPSLSCDAGYDGYDRPFYVPVTDRLERKWLRRSRQYARACDRDGGDLLSHMTTVESAMDLESIRRALDVPKINYYGFSYGTYLGQVYGTMFPDRLRRVIFDGNVNPTTVWYRANLNQDLAFDENIKIYFDWLAEHDGEYRLGDTGREVEKLFYAELAQLWAEPAGGVIGPDEWLDIFLQAAYYVYGWQDLANAFAGWVHDGDWKTLRELYGTPPFDDNGHAVYLAVECTDVQWPQSYDRWRVDNWSTHFQAPFATWGNAWFNAPCLYWSAPASRPMEIDGSGVDGALLINETLDAATPFEGALEVRSRFPNSVLIEGVDGTTHSGSLSGVECVDNRIVRYLTTGALPERKPGRTSDVRCAPVPAPEPVGAEDQPAAAVGERADFTAPVPR